MNKILIFVIAIATLFSSSLLCASVLRSSAIIQKDASPVLFTAISNGNSSNTKNTCSSMKSTTSGGTLDVFLDPSPQPVRNNDQTKFKVIFV